jgi:hypothetical protein
MAHLLEVHVYGGERKESVAVARKEGGKGRKGRGAQ